MGIPLNKLIRKAIINNKLFPHDGADKKLIYKRLSKQPKIDDDNKKFEGHLKVVI